VRSKGGIASSERRRLGRCLRMVRPKKSTMDASANANQTTFLRIFNRTTLIRIAAKKHRAQLSPGTAHSGSRSSTVSA